MLDATNAWTHHVPDSAQLSGINAGILEQAARRAHEQGLAGALFGLDQPTYVAVMTDAESPALRRALLRKPGRRARPIKDPVRAASTIPRSWEEILRLRHEAAQLLEFHNFAEYALANRMARTVPEVTEFLEALVRQAKPAAQGELAELEAFADPP